MRVILTRYMLNYFINQDTARQPNRTIMRVHLTRIREDSTCMRVQNPYFNMIDIFSANSTVLRVGSTIMRDKSTR
jgi:hypothetical protein